ncbi:lipase family protein [Marinibactrum halimedae]|uniref:Fungal lipase-type domain-containing protein n=1 Tax=Marinibactrum halimedae TaxID=1444977 RepID=A0AA37TB95_9GAMM|nr:lipase family protein [Marinibactrum halimedae]MCD9458716.1 lipase family protein [Marinibactrum halimedae]GLS25917.1 hypothetical protein GCM10007877_16320 [Marinibactrum halimedae]
MTNSLLPGLAAKLAEKVYGIEKGKSEASTALNTLKGEITEDGDVSHKILKGIVGDGKSTNLGVALHVETTHEIYLIFRGTVSKGDGLTDANIRVTREVTDSYIHKGFSEAFNSISGQIDRFFRSKRIAAIHCVGHSLGGALAMIAAAWLNKRRNYTNVKVYTFGAPRVGYVSFAKEMTKGVGAKNIFRVYNEFDAIPCLPYLPFVHAPHFERVCGIRIPGIGSNWGTHKYKYCVSFLRRSVVLHHGMSSYRKCVENKSWDDIRKSSQMSLLPSAYTGYSKAAWNWGKMVYRIPKAVLSHGLRFIPVSLQGAGKTIYEIGSKLHGLTKLDQCHMAISLLERSAQVGKQPQSEELNILCDGFGLDSKQDSQVLMDQLGHIESEERENLESCLSDLEV